MENKKIKVLKDTPFDKKDTLLTVEEFSKRYNYIYVRENSHLQLFNYLEQEYELEQKTPRYGIGSWFQVVEDDFKLGDWVWSELMKQALYVTDGSKNGKEWYPCMCTIDAVNENPETYKRKATQEETNYYKLESFCNRTVLIGKHKCYYFNTVWKPLMGIEYNIKKYFTLFKEYGDVYTTDSIWKCNLNGLKVGCTEISHDDILKIAKILEIK